MKRIILLLTVVVFLTQGISIAQNQVFLANAVDGNQIIHRTWYSLSYNEAYEQADWVAYELTATEVNGTTPRKDSFKGDFKITTGTAGYGDYANSGYDRGHLIPAADLKMSEESMSSSFYYSNISPQHRSFNRGIWRSLESIVRNWALTEERVYVITGPVLSKGIIESIGENEIGVPKYFYKVVYDPTDERKAIGFILENSDGNDLPITNYAVTVDSVESFTGLDFYHNLEDSLEEPFESTIDISLWEFNSTVSTTSNNGSAVNSRTSSNTQNRNVRSTSTAQCEYYNGRKIYTGPRGGKYYINSNGNKTYVSGDRRSRIVRRACN
ncbi:MAG: DNA/RNA non-specific endonuclease [Balneola sp.]|nr:MAG: DNA/RNA non-specific endonuclease [Balneola sp.]